MKLLKDAAVQGDVSNLSIFGAYGSCQKTNTKKVPIYWEYLNFGNFTDMPKKHNIFMAARPLIRWSINGFRTDKPSELYIIYLRIVDMPKCLKILLYSH